MNSKKLSLFVLLVICLTVQQFAQNPFKRGVYTLGGSAEGSYSKGEWTGTTSESYMVRINPTFGYFINNNILVGGSFAFSYYEDKYSGSDGYTSKYISRYLTLGPSIRYYFNSESIIPFLEAEIQYLKYLGTDEDGILYGIKGGVNYFLSNAVALEPFLAFSMVKYFKSEERDKNFSVGVRVNYYITK